jgi:hypothetical protein
MRESGLADETRPISEFQGPARRATHVPEFSYRMDRRDLESRPRVRQGQPWVQALLCRDVCGAVSGR